MPAVTLVQFLRLEMASVDGFDDLSTHPFFHRTLRVLGTPVLFLLILLRNVRGRISCGKRRVTLTSDARHTRPQIGQLLL